MKKLMLFVASALLLGGVAIYGQDTTSTYRSGNKSMDQNHSTKSDQGTTHDGSTNGYNSNSGVNSNPVSETNSNSGINSGSGVNSGSGTSTGSGSGSSMGTSGDMKGWTKVNSSDIPASLRQTLSGSQYIGWEKSNVYVSPSGERYSVRIGTTSPKTYYFDKNGKAIEAGSSTMTK
jgi:hypothetical protein